MTYLKIVEPGFEAYTGQLGQYEFVEGRSVETIPMVDVDRLSAAFRFMLVDDAGEEVASGPAERLIAEANGRAAFAESLPRETEEQRVAEQRHLAVKASKPPVSQFFTRKELQNIASEGGIKALRLKADPWGVKHRSIPTLIDMIVSAQAEFLKERDMRMQLAAQAAEAAKPDAVEEDAGGTLVTPSPIAMDNVTVDQISVSAAGIQANQIFVSGVPVNQIAVADLQAAAASGDLASAVSTEGSDEAPAEDEKPAEGEASTQDAAE